jgi:hypothetical protein
MMCQFFWNMKPRHWVIRSWYFWTRQWTRNVGNQLHRDAASCHRRIDISGTLLRRLKNSQFPKCFSFFYTQYDAWKKAYGCSSITRKRSSFMSVHHLPLCVCVCSFQLSFHLTDHTVSETNLRDFDQHLYYSFYTKISWTNLTLIWIGFLNCHITWCSKGNISFSGAFTKHVRNVTAALIMPDRPPARPPVSLSVCLSVCLFQMEQPDFHRTFFFKFHFREF